MRLQCSSAVAMTRQGRRSYGTTRWIDGRRVSFSTHAAAEPGDQVELQLALDGTYDTVWAEVRVARTRRPALGGPLICDAELVYVPPVDRRRLDAWIADRSASVSAHRARARVVERALAGDSLVGDDSLHRGMSWHPTSVAGSDGRRRMGRSAIGAALRASLKRRGVAVQAAAEPAVELSRDGGLVTLSWQSWASFATSWENELSRGWIDVRTASAPRPSGFSATLRLRLPNGDVVPVQGEVVAVTRDGFSLAVDISPALRGRIGRAVAAG
jgi:hypothetical protein